MAPLTLKGDLVLERGEILTGLLGPNGAGKTTLFNAFKISNKAQEILAGKLTKASSIREFLPPYRNRFSKQSFGWKFNSRENLVSKVPCDLSGAKVLGKDKVHKTI